MRLKFKLACMVSYQIQRCMNGMDGMPDWIGALDAMAKWVDGHPAHGHTNNEKGGNDLL